MSNFIRMDVDGRLFRSDYNIIHTIGLYSYRCNVLRGTFGFEVIIGITFLAKWRVRVFRVF